MHICNNNNN